MQRRAFMVSGAGWIAAAALGRAHAAPTRRTQLDFTRGIPAGVAFQRPSRATLWEAETLRTFEADQPRIVRAGNLPQGLLVEGAAHNFLAGAACLPHTSWQHDGVTSEASAESLGAPAASVVSLLTRAAPSKPGRCSTTLRVPGAHTHLTASLWLRAPAARGVWGLMLRDVASSNTVSAQVEVDTHWRRHALTLDASEDDREHKLFALVAVAGGGPDPRPAQRLNNAPKAPPGAPALDRVYSWGAQLEIGGSASSYLTPDSAVRAADDVRMASAPLNPDYGALTLHLPRGGTRAACLVDAHGTAGGLWLGYTASGWLEAQLGPCRLRGNRAATQHCVVRLIWSRNEGAQLWAGPSLNQLRLQAASAEALPSLAFGPELRIGARADGSQALNAVIAQIEIAEPRSLVRGPAPPAPGYAPAGYELAFEDDFDDTDLSRLNEDARATSIRAPAWRSRYRHARREVINQEKQIYVDAAFAGTAAHALGVQPFALRDSVLSIRAEPADPVRVAPHIWNYRYTSGCITSELTHWQTYGYFEIRARLPLGRGFWPAFWLLPKADHWPPEIDVFEASGSRPFAFRPAFAPPRKAPLHKYGCWMRQQIGIHDAFHVYSMEWTPDTIRFGVDGQACFETGRHDIHEDMYLLANLALGSHDPHWIPDPDASTPFPGVFEIDFIRTYRPRKASR